MRSTADAGEAGGALALADGDDRAAVDGAVEDDAHQRREQGDEDREDRHAGDLHGGEFGEQRRRLDAQAPAIGDRGRQDRRSSTRASR